MNFEELNQLKVKHESLREKQKRLKIQILSYFTELGSTVIQHDEVDDPMGGAPTLWELPSVNVGDFGDEILPFAVIGSKPIKSWIEFQLLEQGEGSAATTIDSSSDQITIEVLMSILEAYRYWNDHVQQEKE